MMLQTNQRVVVLVEDHPRLNEAIRRHLETERLQVKPAADYQAAVKVLEDCVPSLVITDLTLPRESGFELCEHIRRTRRLDAVPILVMGDRGSPEDMAHAEQVGANAFLKKPFKRESLLKYVSTLLDGQNASRPSVRRLRRGDPV